MCLDPRSPRPPSLPFLGRSLVARGGLGPPILLPMGPLRSSQMGGLRRQMLKLLAGTTETFLRDANLGIQPLGDRALEPLDRILSAL